MNAGRSGKGSGDREMGVGGNQGRAGIGGGGSWSETLSLRSQSLGCCLEFQNGERDFNFFHMEIGLVAYFVSGWNWSQDQVQ